MFLNIIIVTDKHFAMSIIAANVFCVAYNLIASTVSANYI